jgi:hypothetical protein
MDPKLPQREFNAGAGRKERGHMRVDEKRARYLVEHGLARVVRPEAGPAETKPMEPAEKKSCGAPTLGPLTASRSSSAPGTETASSASAGGLLSRPHRSSSRAAKKTRRGGASA